MRASLMTSASAITFSLATMIAPAQAEEDADRSSPIIVTGLAHVEAAQASKADIPMLETAQAISVVTNDTIEQQGLRRLDQVLFNVAGVSRNNNYGLFDAFNIRGFNASSAATYLDGLLDDAAFAMSELKGLERVEVVKGPASGLYGQGPLSGIVNLVSKRPQEEAFLDASITGGSYDFFELTADANAPLTADGNLLARLTAVYRDQDYFVKASGQRRIFLAPALTWKPGPDTTLTFLGRYLNDHINPWSPTTAYGTILPNPNGKLSIRLPINDADNKAVQKFENWSIGYVLDHSFNDNIAFHQSLRYQESEYSYDRWMFITGISADFRTVYRANYTDAWEEANHFRVDSNLNFKFSTGGIEHNLLVGVDYSRKANDFSSIYDAGTTNPLTRYPLDLYNPVYGTVGAPNPAVLPSGNGNRTRQRGFYVQDHIRLTDILTVTLGGRWDRVSNIPRPNGVSGDKISATAFSPRIGATLALNDWVSLYANYAKSFSPQFSARFADGSALPPERGVNYEGGIKWARTDGKLSGMLTYFELTRENVATADLSPGVPAGSSVITGQQRSRGMELEAGWRPLPGTEFTAAYTYLDAKVTKDNRLPVGSRLTHVPDHILNLWARYTIQKGALANLGVSAGLHYESDRRSSATLPGATVPLTLPGYTLVDAGLFYSFGNWRAQANVRNLFNKRYFPTASMTRVAIGEPRTVMLTLSHRL